jgi:hypothetical protein
MAHVYTHEQMTGWFTRLSPGHQARLLDIAASMPQWPVTIPQPVVVAPPVVQTPTSRRYVEDGWVWLETTDQYGHKQTWKIGPPLGT